MPSNVFSGLMPALMTPCLPDRTPDYNALVAKGQELIAAGMSAVVYCGSMGDWPLLTDAQRMEGVERLVRAGVPVVVGTGAINTASAAWDRAKAVAQIAHDGLWESEASDAVYFHATYVRPRWSRSKTRLAQIDTHVFYR